MTILLRSPAQNQPKWQINEYLNKWTGTENVLAEGS